MIQRFNLGDRVRITPDIARAHFCCPNCDVFKVVAINHVEIVGMARYEIEHVKTKQRRTVFDDGLQLDQMSLTWELSELSDPTHGVL